MDPQITVTDVQVEATIPLPDGERRIADVLLTCTDGRRIAVEIHVTNPKEPEYAAQMESAGIHAIEHHATVSDPDQAIPSAQQILAEATWLWEPYSGRLRKSMEARRRHDRFLYGETQLVALTKAIGKAASVAKRYPQDAHEALLAVASHLVQLKTHDHDQQRTLAELRSRTQKGLAFTHTRAHEVKAQPFRKLVSAVIPTPNVSIRPITQDKLGSWLRRDTRHILNQRANQVARLGFRQSGARATLFTASAGTWRMYVDFDSTDIIRIWEVDCEPAIYAFPENPPEQRELLLAALSEKLTMAKVPHRRYFPDPSEETCRICHTINESNADLHQWLST